MRIILGFVGKGRLQLDRIIFNINLQGIELIFLNFPRFYFYLNKFPPLLLFYHLCNQYNN